MKCSVKASATLIAVLAMTACVTSKKAVEPELPADQHRLFIPGISGLAWAGENSFLAVQDAKTFNPDEPRLGLISIDTEKQELSYRRLAFPAEATSLSNDLEGVCRVPNRPGEFLLSESGYWNRRHGRIFHISVTDFNVKLIRELNLPLIRDNNEHQRDGDQFEGIACTDLSSHEVLIVIGERGGTSVYPDGILRWGRYNLTNGQLSWSTNAMTIKAPNPWSAPNLRSITSLSIDADKRLWASAAVDAGDLGPFQSLVYQIGTVSKNAEQPVSIMNNPMVHVIDGFKVEGLTVGIDNSGMSIGTEDEALGGNWRHLSTVEN